MKEQLQYLNSIKDVTFEIDKNLKKYSTMHLNAVGNLITVKGLEALKAVLKFLFEKKIAYLVLGKGANTLLKSSSSIPYLQLDFSYDKSLLGNVQGEYLLPASINLATLTSHASKYGLKGWEVFTGIPATLGGAIFMNAGTNLGEIGNIVKEVYIVTKNGEEKLIKIDQHSFSYRHNHFLKEGDIVYQARLIHLGIDPLVTKKIRDYLEMRTRTQPLKEWTCGCIFKNFQKFEGREACRAGLFIDIIGLKGLSYKNLRISPKHANFMENMGESSYEDVISMIKILEKELKLQTGISFEPEVEL